MTNLALTAVASLFATMAARTVLVTDKAGAVAKFKFARLDAKLGKLKNGEQAEYVVLQRADDEAVVINLHPQSALRLMKKGEEAGMALEPEAEAAPVTTTEASTETTTTEAGAEASTEAPAEPKAPSKKEQFIAIFLTTANGVKAAGGDPKTVRQLVKTNVASLGLSDAGFNTYFQNVKSGKWAV